MANVSITNLPAAQPLTGTELVPVVQDGLTVRTTTAAIAASPSLTQTFLTVNNEPTLPNSRYFSTDANLTLSDGGAQSFYRISLTGAAASLNTAGNGVVVKSGTSILNRTLSTSGNGLSVANGDGISGNPTFSLTGNVQSLANASGTGLLVLTGPSALTFRSILGTANEIDVADATGVSGNPTIGLADNPTLPGTGATIVPKGTTAQQPAGVQGQFRYNTDSGTFEGYTSAGWGTFSTAGGVTTFSAGTTGFSPSAPTAGAIVLTGTLNVTNGGTGATSLTGYVKGSGTSAFTASATIPTTDLSGQITNAQLQNSAITIGLTSVSLGGSITTLTGTSISGSSNTLSNIGNSSLTNSSITINGTSVSLGGSATITSNTANSLTFNNSGSGDASGTTFNGSAAKTISYNTVGASPLAGSVSLTTLGTVTTGTWNATPIGNSYLANSSLTIGTTSISLGGSSLTLGGLTSVAVTQDPTQPLQLATKQYVDAVTEGLHIHASCAAATPASLASITGGTVTYNNGTAGVGATLTLSVALTVLDGYTLQNGNRVLVKNESNQAYNGIYTWATGGTVLTRATDFDTTTEIASGDYTFVTYGTLYASTGWVQTNPTTAIGTSPIAFVQFSGAGTYTAGTGLTLTGTQFSITNTGVTAASYGTASSVPTIAVNAQGQITSASNTSIAINGNQITSGTVGSAYISGSYTGITGVGTLTAGTWNASAISDTYLSTISTAGKVSNSATTATSANTASAIVARDASGNFSAGTITATLSGNASTATTATNATNTAITANSANATNYLTFVSATTGNLPQLVNSSITCNPSTGAITGGISGGTF